MVVVVPGPAQLDTRVVSCWATNDSSLGLFVAFIGQSTTTNITQSSSRIQSHVFSLAGLLSFPRLTINPSSALYSAVNHLPDNDQGDEVRRGLAVSLLKYFTEIPQPVRNLLLEKAGANATVRGHGGTLIELFKPEHAALLASRMRMVENAAEVADRIATGMAEKSVSWLDIDLVLPESSISLIQPTPLEGRGSLVPLPDLRPEIDYGRYSTLVDLLGETAFLPTARMRRAPSKPTAVSRTRVLDKDKEDGLRREIQELIATERSYVQKLTDLEQSIAAGYAREVARQASGHTLSAGDQAIKTLFPSSLSKILALNERFLQTIEQIADTSSNVSGGGSGSGSSSRAVRDPTGGLAFSKAMLEYFPHFREPYQHYLRNSSRISNILGDLLRDRNSPWANAITASGEQRLKSWLIEPVQRLPRYSLFIDNMANLLPADHPAMSRFLRARDIVTDICALESDDPMDGACLVRTLQELVLNWPAAFEPRGRLINAVDAIQLAAPYVPDPYGRSGDPLIILLFSDQLVFLDKIGNMSSRGLLAEVDRQAPVTSGASATTSGNKSFSFARSMQLSRSRCMESHAGKLLHLDGPAVVFDPNDSDDSSNATSYDSSDVFQLLGAYDGKAAKFAEEIALSLIESRFPEKMRENERWTLKSQPPSSGSEGLGLIAAVFQSDDLLDLVTSRSSLGRTRIVVDQSTNKLRDPESRRPVDSSVEIVVNVSTLSGDKFSVEIFSYGRQASVDAVSKEDFTSLLVKRLGYVLRIHNRPFNEDMAFAAIGLAREIAICIQPRYENDQQPTEAIELPPERSGSTRKFRPLSPVKGLASIFSSTSSSSMTRQPYSPVKSLSSLSRANSTKTTAAAAVINSQQAGRQTPSNELTDSRFAIEPKKEISPLEQLDGTFKTYVVALQTRKGNVIGRVVHGRANADELAVNELYNTLIQHPLDHQAAAEVPVDVLFAAFEKFLNVAWREQAGPVIPPTVLRDIQSLLFSDVPGMVQQFKAIMSELSRQNQRALKALISVLAELVDATSNDGDRGALVMTFAEVLVVEGDPIDYIMLFDRLLADADVLFGVQPPGSSSSQDAPDRSRATNTGSIGSTASSIGKKLGFFSGLSRGNSKAGESESRVTQVLRQLSKRSNADSESTPPSISRSFLSRGQSQDSRPTTPGSHVSRPGSSHSGGPNPESPRPGSAHGLRPLAPINEGKMGPPRAVPVRKKRRSSLSDLTDLKQADSAALGTLVDTPRQSRPNGLQKTPSTSSVLDRGRPNPYAEVQPLNLQDKGGLLSRTTSTDERSLSRNTKSPTPSGIFTARHEANIPQLAVSGVPILSPSKSSSINKHNDMNTGASATSATSSSQTTSSPNKLRMQSPQKLRERLDREKQTLSDAGPDLQAELASIGRELAASSPLKSSTSSSGPHSKQKQQQPPTTEALSARLATLEATLKSRLDSANTAIDAIRADYESSLAVSERKGRSLDELYREANAENELLYDRFNGELSRVLKAVKGGGGGGDEGVQEMRRVMQQKQDEAARLRKENQRLRRENLGLKSQLRDPS